MIALIEFKFIEFILLKKKTNYILVLHFKWQQLNLFNFIKLFKKLKLLFFFFKSHIDNLISTSIIWQHFKYADVEIWFRHLINVEIVYFTETWWWLYHRSLKITRFLRMLNGTVMNIRNETNKTKIILCVWFFFFKQTENC